MHDKYSLWLLNCFRILDRSKTKEGKEEKGQKSWLAVKMIMFILLNYFYRYNNNDRDGSALGPCWETFCDRICLCVTMVTLEYVSCHHWRVCRRHTASAIRLGDCVVIPCEREVVPEDALPDFVSWHYDILLHGLWEALFFITCFITMVIVIHLMPKYVCVQQKTFIVTEVEIVQDFLFLCA